MRKRDIRHDFSSVPDFVEYVANNRRPNGYEFNRPNKAGWVMTTGIEAVNLGITGDTEHAKALFEAVATVKSAGEIYIPALRRDVTGDFFDVGDVLAGVPECWFARADEAAKQAVKITFHIGAACCCSPEEITNRGAALVTIVDALAQGGYLLEISLIYKGIEGKTPLEMQIDINNDPLDIDALAFMCCNPAAIRRILFSWMEMVVGADRAGEYGHTEHDLPYTGNGTPEICFDYLWNGRYQYIDAQRTRNAVNTALAQLANGETFVKMPGRSR